MTFWEEPYTVNDKEYRLVEANGFNLVQTDGGGSSAGRLYCVEDQWEQAEAYYANSDNYLYYCSVGVENVKTGTVPVVSEIPEVDAEKFNALIAFAEENRYKPFGPSKDNTRRLPYPDMQETPPFFSTKKARMAYSSRGEDRISTSRTTSWCFYTAMITAIEKTKKRSWWMSRTNSANTLLRL